jgi:hypothetical protein
MDVDDLTSANSVTTVLERFARELMDKIAKSDLISDLHCRIELTGRASSRQPVISYEYGLTSYYANPTKGHDPLGTFNEFLRRLSWNERNRPVALPASTSKDSPLDKAKAP